MSSSSQPSLRWTKAGVTFPAPGAQRSSKELSHLLLANPAATQALLEYLVEISITDDTDEGLLVASDGEMTHHPTGFISYHISLQPQRLTYRLERELTQHKHQPPLLLHIQPFTISCVNERDCLPLPDFVVNHGDDDDGDDLPGNISALPNVGIEGNERAETSSAGTTSSGPATKKPRLSTTLDVVKKA
ncbi:hypothetical protein Rs2_46774 [Raphanus sativus]|nr:hypothetical protein Rs2_46774 [Raphanus sativus]